VSVLVVVAVLDATPRSPERQRRRLSAEVDTNLIEPDLHPGDRRLTIGDAPDGRRQIGSTPAGGDVESTEASCEQPPASPIYQPDEARDSVPAETLTLTGLMAQAGGGNRRRRSASRRATRTRNRATASSKGIVRGLVAGKANAIVSDRRACSAEQGGGRHRGGACAVMNA